jgi:hypothetical protein
MCWVPLRSTQPKGESDRTGDNTITRGISANLIVSDDSVGIETTYLTPQTVLEGNLGYSSPVKESVSKVTLFDDQSVKTSIGEVGITEVTFGKGSSNGDTTHKGMGEINFGSITIDDTSINQVSRSKVGIVKNRGLYPSSLQIGFSQISSVEEAMRNFSADRLNGSHYSIDKFAHYKIGTSQVGMAEDRFSQIQLSELAKSQISSGQVSSLPIRFMSFQPSQIGSNQIGSSQSNIVHPSFEQDCRTQIGIGQVNRAKHNLSEIGSTEIDTSQINTSAIDRDTIEINPTQINPTKVSFPSSISLQQFFTSHANTFLLMTATQTAASTPQP